MSVGTLADIAKSSHTILLPFIYYKLTKHNRQIEIKGVSYSVSNETTLA
jgi:hypothetical protein